MKKVFLTAVFLLAATPTLAAHWNVDYAKSKLGFTVRWSNEPFVATFKSWKANIDFDPADPTHAHVLATISIASEVSDTPDNDDGLKGPEGFAASQFPEAKFEATGFTPQGTGKYVANGKLTIRNLTRPLSLPFMLTLKGDNAHMVGTAQVTRTDFGIGQGQWAASDPIAHEVAINIDLVASEAH